MTDDDKLQVLIQTAKTIRLSLENMADELALVSSLIERWLAATTEALQKFNIESDIEAEAEKRIAP